MSQVPGSRALRGQSRAGQGQGMMKRIRVVLVAVGLGIKTAISVVALGTLSDA